MKIAAICHLSVSVFWDEYHYNWMHIKNSFQTTISLAIYNSNTVFHGEDGDDANANTDLEGLVLDLVGNLSWHAVPALLLVMHLKLNDDHDHDRDLDDDDDDENHNLLVHILSMNLRLTNFCPWQIW